MEEQEDLTGSYLWKEFITKLGDLNSSDGGVYTTIFYSTLELLREAVNCYDSSCYAATAMVCRAVIDKSIFVVQTTIILPENTNFTCSVCGDNVKGFSNLNGHDLKHRQTTQFWFEINGYLHSQNVRTNPKDYSDDWGELKSISIDCGLLTKDETEEIEKEIRAIGNANLHPQRAAKEQIKWRITNQEKLNELSRGKTVEINWKFSPSKKEANSVLCKTMKFLEIIIRNYLKKQQIGFAYNVLGVI